MGSDKDLKIAVYTWQNRVTKEEADEVRSRVSAVETQFLNVEIGKVYKASVCCCFYVILLQVVVLCYDGVCLITKSAQGEKGKRTSFFIIITTISIIVDFSGLILPFGTLVRILELNASYFLKSGGYFVINQGQFLILILIHMLNLYLANCIDSTIPVEAVFASEMKKLQAEQFKPMDQVTLKPSHFF
uniref:Uncharacterized protein n=1 Tax=Lactuca sativa TaxID=4236 RepID=A0A9R1UU27_LACSA|nr:hypothetical protein LSAT_V11C800404130 [Lactuca sativa]